MRTDETYRHECEVRWLAPLPDWRVTEYLKQVEKARGRPAVTKLAADVRETRRASQASMATAGSPTKG